MEGVLSETDERGNDKESRTEEAEVVNEEVNCVSREEVKNALRRMKKGEAVGPDELPVGSLEVHGRDGDKVFSQTVHRLLVDKRMPEEWRRVCLSQSIKTKGTHSVVEATEE